MVEKYCDDGKIICFGDKTPETLPRNIQFHSITEKWDWKADKKSFGYGLKQALQQIDDDLIIITLPDMWPVATVDSKKIEIIAEYLKQHDKILSIFIGDDINLRSSKSKGVGNNFFDRWQAIDLFTVTPTHNYYGSFGSLLLLPSLWNRKAIVPLLEDATIWDWEIKHKNKLANLNNFHCLWTKEIIYPLEHLCFRDDVGIVKLTKKIIPDDKSLIRSLLPKDIRIIEI